MIWIYILGPFCLGGGMVLANFRRKDNKQVRKGVAVLSVVMMLVFALCMFLTPLGAFCVNIGAWLVRTASSGGVGTVLGTAVICLILFSFGFLFFGVLRDIWKDGTPDRPTYIATMTIWIVVGLTVGVASGPKAYDEFTAEVMKTTRGGW